MEFNEQYIQGGGLLGRRDGLALQLQPAELRPANAVQVGTSAHVLEQHQQCVAVLVFDWLEIHLPEVLSAQQALHAHQEVATLIYTLSLDDFSV